MKKETDGKPLLSLEIQLGEFGLDALPHIWVGFGFHLLRPESWARFALLMLAAGAFRFLGRIGRELCLAVVASVVWDRVGTEHVAGVSIRILVLLGSARES